MTPEDTVVRAVFFIDQLQGESRFWEDNTNRFY